MFRIGEHVMYRNIGICEVEAIGKIGFSFIKVSFTCFLLLTQQKATQRSAFGALCGEK